MSALLERLPFFRRRPILVAKFPGRGRPKHGWPWFLAGVLLGVVALSGLYFWGTSGRTLTQPVRLDYGPASPAFAAVYGPLLGAEFTGGNSVEVLVNGVEFFPAMLSAIAGAQQTITLETYIWTSGTISDRFIAALSERARHGVKVLVLIDGMAPLEFKQADRTRLSDSGVQLRTYARHHWYDFKLNFNHRTHRKILVVDGKVGFTGGMCIDDQWLGDADSTKVWRETQVRVAGPVVREMQAVFASNWLETTSGLLLGADYFPPITARGGVLAQCIESGPGEGPENARICYLLAIASARESIDLSSAYFVPDDLSIETLLEARARGVRVRIIIPALTDSRMGRAASRSRWRRLLAAGVEFYQYLPAMDHCKVLIVDEVFVCVGSINFDNRSFSLNDEIALNTLDRSVARTHLKVFADDLQQSQRITREEFESRPFYQKLADELCGLFRSQF